MAWAQSEREARGSATLVSAVGADATPGFRAGMEAATGFLPAGNAEPQGALRDGEGLVVEQLLDWAWLELCANFGVAVAANAASSDSERKNPC